MGLSAHCTPVGELGIYYEDLYHIVRPFHEHHIHPQEEPLPSPNHTDNGRMPKRQRSIESCSQLNSAQIRKSASFTKTASSHPDSLPQTSSSTLLQPEDAVAPPINSYGTIGKGLPFSASRTSLVSSNSSLLDDERDPLLPAVVPGPQSGTSADLVPFRSIMLNFRQYFAPCSP